MFGPSETTLMVLKATLELAVPLWADKLMRQPLDAVLRRASICGQVIAEKGDVIQFKSSKPGETANAFNHLAEGLAILSFAPGGVKFMGIHFENTHPGTTRPCDDGHPGCTSCDARSAADEMFESVFHIIDALQKGFG